MIDILIILILYFQKNDGSVMLERQKEQIGRERIE